MKEKADIDQRITDFFVTTTLKTNNKDVCYYASFNFPAFIWVTGKKKWQTFRKLYLKLTSSNDVPTLRSLSASIHELARILGPDVTNEDLLPIAERFLTHNNLDVRMACMKNFHVFLAEVHPKKRSDYI